MFNEGVVDVVVTVEVDCGGVVDGSSAVFEKWKNVGFELSCKFGEGVVRGGAEKCFELWGGCAMHVLDCKAHGKFRADCGADEADWRTAVVVGCNMAVCSVVWSTVARFVWPHWEIERCRVVVPVMMVVVWG